MCVCVLFLIKCIDSCLIGVRCVEISTDELQYGHGRFSLLVSIGKVINVESFGRVTYSA